MSRKRHIKKKRCQEKEMPRERVVKKKHAERKMSRKTHAERKGGLKKRDAERERERFHRGKKTDVRKATFREKKDA